MLKHILVPLDGSELAEEAVEYAKGAVCSGGKITLLTVVDVPDLPVYYYYPAPLVAQEKDYANLSHDLADQAQEYLSRIAKKLQDEGLTVDLDVQIGDAATVITDRAHELGVDAICISTHGRSGIERWLFGSVTNKVLSSATCPVLVVPGKKMLEKRKAAQSKKQEQV